LADIGTGEVASGFVRLSRDSLTESAVLRSFKLAVDFVFGLIV
jgi:hypothetical protein